MRFFNFSRVGNATLTSAPSKSESPKPRCRSELSKEVASIAGFSKKDADLILDCYLKAIETSIREGRSVVIPGFGKFKPRRPRTGSYHNPITGKKMPAPEKRSISFQPSIVMKQNLNERGA